MRLNPDLRRAILVAAVITGVVFLGWRLFTSTYLDLRVYIAGAQALIDGNSLYDSVNVPNQANLTLPFTYPPFAAVIFIPFAILPINVALVLWFVIALGSLVGICYLTALRLPALAGKSKPTWATWEIAALIFAISAFSEPVNQNFDVAQVNLLIVFVVMYDTVNRTKYAGFATGMAAGFKVTPALFIVLMLVTRRWADFGRALMGFAVTLIIGSFFGIDNVWRYWSSEVFKTERVGDAARLSNMAIRGIMARFFPGSTGVIIAIIVAVVIAVAALAIGAAWWTRSRLVSAMVVGLGTLLASPISWPHHWVWLVPAISVCIALALRAFQRGHKGLGWLLVVSATLGGLAAMLQLRFFLVLVFDYEWFRLWIVGTVYAVSAILMLMSLGMGARLVGPGLQEAVDAPKEPTNS